jgi:hypothetical protein
VEHKDAELGLGSRSAGAHALTGNLDVLLKLLDSVLEGRPGVVNLVNDEDSLADKVLHLAQGG